MSTKLPPKRAARATKAELCEEICQLRRVGQQMSNVLYNLSQYIDIARYKVDKIRDLVHQWGTIKQND